MLGVLTTTWNVKWKRQRFVAHVNRSLPPVGIVVLIKARDGEWVKTRRELWITSKDGTVDFILEDGQIETIERGQLEWIYP
jgi:hypothetical protein